MTNAQATPRSELIRDISPNDTMFEGDESHYFDVGQAVFDQIGFVLNAAGRKAEDVKRILDLPCGHGRVLRHLRHAYPDATIVACDLDRDGVDYCAATFDAIRVYSVDDPRELQIERDWFDLIFVGSLFTHLDGPRWSEFLEFFRDCLRPGGVLVFSTHGRYVHGRLVGREVTYSLPEGSRQEVLGSYERTGFGYDDYPNVQKYGYSLSHPTWVFKAIEPFDDLRLVYFAEKAWYRHHDIVGVTRDPDWRQTIPGQGVVGRPTSIGSVVLEPPASDQPEIVDAAFFTEIDQSRSYIDHLIFEPSGLLIQGWMLHPDFEITHLKVYLDNTLVGSTMLKSRPDVAAVFSWLPYATQCGINILIPYPSEQSRVGGHLELIGCQGERPLARVSLPYRTDMSAIPTPPPHLTQRVANTTNVETFKSWGLKCYSEFAELFLRHGKPSTGDRFLDWGCGCGRLAPHFMAEADGPEVFGCDVDGEAVAWCNQHLQAGHYETIPLLPPTIYKDASFQYAIGYSIFTHLTKEVQNAWLAELRRILAPGGILIVTVHGDSATAFSFNGKVDEILVDGFHDESIDLNLDGVVPADYYRGTFQSREYTFREWSKYFDIIEYKERGIGNHQDAVVMRRRDS